MKNSKLKQLVITIVLCFIIVILGSTALHIPTLYFETDLSLYPAMLLAQGVMIGIPLCIYGLYLVCMEPVLARRRLARSLAQSVSAPWAANPQWRRREVVHTSAGKVIFLWLFVINWWGAVWFFVQDIGHEMLEAPLAVQIFSGTFLIVGMVIVRLAVINTTSWVKFGKSSLMIETLPGQPGCIFRGTIKTGFKKKPKRAALLQIIASERQWRREVDATEGYKRRGDVRELGPIYANQIKVPPKYMALNDLQLEIPVKVPIPSDVPNTGAITADTEVVWTIYVSFTVSNGLKYQASFEIPVYATNTISADDVRLLEC